MLHFVGLVTIAINFVLPYHTNRESGSVETVSLDTCTPLSKYWTCLLDVPSQSQALFQVALKNAS